MEASLAVQLHGIREEAAQDLGAVLERVARIGYLGVELGSGGGLFGMTPEDFRRRLDELGLSLIGSSLPADRDLSGFLDEQEMLGNDVLFSSLLPEHVASREALARSAERLNEIGEIVRRRGITLLYHNHSWDIRPSKKDGWVPLWTLVELLDPQIGLEPDIYWIKGAGLDPAETLARLGARVRRLHIKDGPGTACDWPNEPAWVDPQVAVGSGVLDIPAALAAAPQADWHVIDFDACETDIFDALDGSYRYLTENGFSKGRGSAPR
jgi:sugar phosphate isomerase/epimerase